MTPGILKPADGEQPKAVIRTPRRGRARSSLLTHGEPWVWLTGGALVLSVAMIAGLLGLILWQGLSTFWQGPIVTFVGTDGQKGMGEVSLIERYTPEPSTLQFLPEDEQSAIAAAQDENGALVRTRFRTGNNDITGTHYEWKSEYEVASTELDEWAVMLERQSWGRFYGKPVAFLVDGEQAVEGAEASWALFEEHHGASRDRFDEQHDLEKGVIGSLRKEEEAWRLRVRGVELESGTNSPEHTASLAEFAEATIEIRGRSVEANEEILALRKENQRFELVMETASGQHANVTVADIVRAVPANRLRFVGKLGVYVSRWWEFLVAEPREANAEGGVYPAIFGTVVMTLLMSILVVPLGVLAALYLREYAKQGLIISAVRIAVNNLAGVPSIVFGIFGLGFFCYIIGARIDELFYAESLPTPTFGTRGILWAALTLALLTLPVVIVATEEALAAVPNSMREGSYACGATKWQTIQRIVLPRAAPGIMTGVILAIARGAGEVAPLMLVGAMKLAPSLPIDGEFPFLHPSRSFMHLGFHIFDLGFHSQNSEAAKPMVYTTTLLLIGIVVLLNLAAIWVRARLRRRFEGGTI